MIKRRFFIKHAVLAFLSLLFPSSTFSKKNRLPNVLIIGDSISIGYYPFVKKTLEGQVNLSRPMLKNGGFQNCAGTTNGIKKIFIIDCKIKKIKEYLINIFRNSLFFIPLDQNISVWF